MAEATTPVASRALHELAAALDDAALPDYSALVGARLRQEPVASGQPIPRVEPHRPAARRKPRTLAVVAGSLAASVLAMGTVATLRDASAQGGQRVAAAPGGAVVGLDVARTVAPFDVAVPDGARPAVVLVGAGDPAPYVSMVYAEPAQGYATRQRTASYVVAQIAGSAAPYFGVLSRSEPGVTSTSVGGARALWLPSAAPLVYEDPDGHRRVLPPRTAHGALVWVRGGVTFRVEVDGPLDTALRLAGQLSGPAA